MKRFIGSCAALGLILGCIGCNQNPASGPEKTVTVNPDAGKFGISHLRGLGKSDGQAAVKEGENIRFDLGKIKGSTGFFFLLYNVGATPITNVTLGTDNNSFSVYPTSMDTLVPGSDLGMLPIVKINAFHGTPLDGVGNRPLLPKGDNMFTLTVKGTTKTGSGADTTVEMQAEMDIEALVLDFKVTMLRGELPLADRPGSYNDIFKDHPVIGNKLINAFGAACLDDSIIGFTNTGNVPLQLQAYRCMYEKGNNATNTSKVIDTTLPIAATISIPFDPVFDFNKSLVLVASGSNTISDPSRIRQNEDGACYLQFYPSSETCATMAAGQSLTKFMESKNAVDCAKLFALIDDKIIFYTQQCPGNDSLYGLYDLTGAPQCVQTVSGGKTASDCTDTGNSGLLDSIVANLTGSSPDFKTLGLPWGRITGGSLQGWDGLTLPLK